MALLGLIFGTGPKLVIGEIDVEIAVAETHERQSQITKNPVEQGVDISDHVQILPRTLVIEGAVSNTPIRFLSGVRSVLSSAFSLITDGNLGKSLTANAYDALVKLHEDKEPIDIETGFDLYTNMLLKSLRVPRDQNSGSVMRFQAVFEEVVIVSSSFINLPAGLGGITSNLGKVPTKAASPTGTNGSLLSRATGLAG